MVTCVGEQADGVVFLCNCSKVDQPTTVFAASSTSEPTARVHQSTAPPTTTSTTVKPRPSRPSTPTTTQTAPPSGNIGAPQEASVFEAIQHPQVYVPLLVGGVIGTLLGVTAFKLQRYVKRRRRLAKIRLLEISGVDHTVDPPPTNTPTPNEPQPALKPMDKVVRSSSQTYHSASSSFTDSNNAAGKKTPPHSGELFF